MKHTGDYELDEINMLEQECSDLEEENKTLKNNVEFLHSCLDDRDKSIAIMQEENKKLKEKVETLELWLDNKEKLNEEYRKQLDKYKRQYEHSM